MNTCGLPLYMMFCSFITKYRSILARTAINDEERERDVSHMFKVAGGD